MFQQLAIICAVLFVTVRAQGPPMVAECLKDFERNLTETDKKVFSSPPPPGPQPTAAPALSHAGYCVVECIMKKNHILNNGKVDMEAAAKMMDSMKPSSPPTDVPGIKAAMSKCAKDLKETRDCEISKAMVTCIKREMSTPVLLIFGGMF